MKEHREEKKDKGKEGLKMTLKRNNFRKQKDFSILYNHQTQKILK